MTEHLNSYHPSAKRRNLDIINLWAERLLLVGALALFWFLIFSFGRLFERFHGWTL